MSHPRWRHSDGRPYDDFDYGFTRFTDDADEPSFRDSRRLQRVSLFTKLLGWFRPAADPEQQAEAERLRVERETIRTSQFSPYGGSNLPPTRDITDPRP